ncbi:hypothetical protein [Phaeodactylibacter luteus]|uniref:Transporter n=1 Tax=Phaeodactylibacter luteus TaxID=1564516 RepID=A0A5C6RIM2_9BACT|nr:hypothetical protein [Phaeodactylibacter luteus]TXB61834.1 hypothetical protein FRY97_17180 [Phaeodactylibacter luteus]
MLRIFTCTLGTLLISLTTLSAQGPISGFMNSGGTLDIALGYATESFDEYLFGNTPEARSLTTQSYNLFTEYSFNKRGALVASIPYLIIDEQNRGLQDGSFFLKYLNGQQRKSKGLLSTITAVGITAPLSSYPTATENPIGVGAFMFQGRIALQYQADYGFFAHVQTGADFRFLSPLQTAIPILARAGFGGRWYFAEVWSEWYNTLNNGTDQSVTGGSGSDWARVGATLYLPIWEGLGIAGNAAWIVSGENIGLSRRYGLSLVYRLQTQPAP